MTTDQPLTKRAANRLASTAKAEAAFRRYCDGESIEKIAPDFGYTTPNGLYLLFKRHGFKWRKG